MTATRSFAHALSASLCFGIGVGELARIKTIEEVTAEARDIVRVHGCRAYVYRSDGRLRASMLELEYWSGAELVAQVDPSECAS
jgi:hypothetical protein